MMSWIKDAVEAAKIIRKYRRAGGKEAFTIVPEDRMAKLRKAEKAEDDLWFAEQRVENLQGWLKMREKEMEDRCAAYKASYQLAYDCIEDMAQGKSRCRWCLFRDGCQDPKKGNIRGCPEWALKLPEEDENEQAAAEENRAAEQENHQAPVQGDDEGTADGRPGEERDHGGGSAEGMA